MLKRIVWLVAFCAVGVPAFAGLTDFDAAASLSSRGLLLTLLIVFAAGVLVSFTPCVYPMIPITLSIIGARSAEPTTPSGVFAFLRFCAWFSDGLLAAWLRRRKIGQAVGLFASE